ncbi:MAG: hypothetical protein ACKVY0_05080 [Prosthecobacter sp.]|uniref:hypothetical protein n=1 Tax=Prosthecobacter sp. TaxID=1965333 RepID=UPI003901C7E2
MIPDIGERPMTADEWLARYILRREHVRADGTLKPDPFMPYKWVELSVTRHLGLEESEIWQAGQTVADETGTTLQGRADALAQVYAKHRLRVLPKPLPNNLNHADVVDWPADKPAQKEIALMIAREASYQPKPVE